jgi:type VI protein secretion system component VasK
MLAATDYPLLNIFWSMLLLFLWIAWFWILIVILGDVFRRHDISGWFKALWVIFMIVMPFLGVFIYIITQSRGMSERHLKQAQAAQQQFDEYVKTVATSSGSAAEIEKAKGLLDSGAITKEEFEQLKRKALA